MSKKYKAVLLFATILALVFLVFAFVIWDVDPSRWSGEARGGCAFLGLMIATMFTGFYMESNTN